MTDILRQDTLKAIPGCQFVSGYGMTEIASCIASDEFLENKLGMAVMNGLQVKICDDSFNALERGRRARS